MMRKIKRVVILLLLMCGLPVTVLAAPAAGVAQVPASLLSVLYHFGAKTGDPAMPQKIGLVAQGRDGNLYGTTPGGGAHGRGAVYKITLDGAMTTLYSFDIIHGAGPLSGLTLGNDGDFYGTTNGGGKYAAGTIFKITSDGALTTLYDFRNGAIVPRPVGRQPTAQEILDAAGSYPLSGLVQGRDGSLYGVVPTGNIQRDGVLYRISPSGDFHGLHNFHDESVSYPSCLIAGTDGNLYGTALVGPLRGLNGCVFKATTDGAVSLLYKFDGVHGAGPYNIIQGKDGNLYGTANLGGSIEYARGLVYQLTPGGAFTVLHTFNGTDGGSPTSGVVQGKDGNLYGVNSWGGPKGIGVFYRLQTNGLGFTILYSFRAASGGYPSAPPIQLTNGKFYGTTGARGLYDVGTFYSLDITSTLQVTDVCLGLPQLATSDGGRSLKQSVYVHGMGKGPFSGHWLEDGKPTPIFVNELDLSSGGWVKLADFQQEMISHRNSAHHTLQFVVDSDNAPATSIEAVDCTGFIPSIDGWPFANSAGNILAGIFFLPFPDYLPANFLSLPGVKSTYDKISQLMSGQCAGFTVSARDNYNQRLDLPSSLTETEATAQLIKTDNDESNDYNYNHGNNPILKAALSYETESDDTYKAAIKYEADAIQNRIKRDDSCVIYLYPLEIAPKKADAPTHAVIAVASFFSSNIYVAQAKTKVKEMRLFSIYDPNYPADDNRYLGAFGSFDHRDASPAFQFMPAGDQEHDKLKMWAPDPFYRPR